MGEEQMQSTWKLFAGFYIFADKNKKYYCILVGTLQRKIVQKKTCRNKQNQQNARTLIEAQDTCFVVEVWPFTIQVTTQILGFLCLWEYLKPNKITRIKLFVILHRHSTLPHADMYFQKICRLWALLIFYLNSNSYIKKGLS